MKLVKGLFLVLGFAGLFSAYQSDAMAKDYKNCGNEMTAGRFCKDGKDYQCPEGCYCTGGKMNSVQINNVRNSCKNRKNKAELNKANIFLCPDETPNSPAGASNETQCQAANDCDKAFRGKYCKEKNNHKYCPEGCYCPGESSGKKATGDLTVTTYCGDKNKYASVKGKLAGYGIMYCPDNFPYSDNSAENEEKCYVKKSSGNGKLYYKKSKSYAGGYLKKNTDSNSPCEKNYWCPGGEWYPDPNEDQGIYACPSEYPYSTAGAKSITDCYGVVKDAAGNITGNTHPSSATLVCAQGKYFDANTQACKDCPANHVCPGVTVTLPQYTDQGICNGVQDPLCKLWMKHNGNPLFDVGGSGAGGGDYSPESVTCHVVYVCDNGLGQTKTEIVNDAVFTLVDDFCTVQDGKEFKGWVIDGELLTNETYTCDNKDLTFIAKWDDTEGEDGDDENADNETQDSEESDTDSDSETDETQNDDETDNTLNIVNVKEGQYLPKGTSEPVSCVGYVYSNQFCPGGDFYPNQYYNQGIYTCVNGGTANAGRTACRVSLDENDLMHGILGQGECWMIENNMDEYRSCVFGGAYDVSMQ